MRYYISGHALLELGRRKISRELLGTILSDPEQIVEGKGGRRIYQSRIVSDGGKWQLVRVVVDELDDPPVVVTVYRTSRISAYWRPS